jgi:hypothetical protein
LVLRKDINIPRHTEYRETIFCKIELMGFSGHEADGDTASFEGYLASEPDSKPTALYQMGERKWKTSH